MIETVLTDEPARAGALSLPDMVMRKLLQKVSEAISRQPLPSGFQYTFPTVSGEMRGEKVVFTATCNIVKESRCSSTK